MLVASAGPYANNLHLAARCVEFRVCINPGDLLEFEIAPGNTGNLVEFS